jgi:hypothetical protein
VVGVEEGHRSVVVGTWVAGEKEREKAFDCGACKRLRACDQRRHHQVHRLCRDCPSCVLQTHLQPHHLMHPIYHAHLHFVVVERWRRDRRSTGSGELVAHSGVVVAVADSRVGSIAVEAKNKVVGHRTEEADHKVVVVDNSFGFEGGMVVGFGCQDNRVAVGSIHVSQDNNLQVEEGSDTSAGPGDGVLEVVDSAIGLDSGMVEVVDCFRDHCKVGILESC